MGWSRDSREWPWVSSRSRLGYGRLRHFQPLQSLFRAGVKAGVGSEHMQKIGSLRSINPYTPFLGMRVAITRRAEGYGGRLRPEEALTREQAIRLYTINNARLLSLEGEVGSLEAGKRADFVALDLDLLRCPEEEKREIRVVAKHLDGKPVFERTETS
jgi:predicted amidohydrolase YtcJ